MLEGKRIVVTGGTGSLGKVLVRRLLAGDLGLPRKIVVLSRDEGKQHAMRMAYLHRTVTTDEVIYRNFMHALEFRIGDVRDYADVVAAIADANVVINAAALKQVPTCEYFPDQAVLTNCVGASNIVRAVREHGHEVETVVAVSTDKACKPVNVMGMTKAVQERIFIAANVTCARTRFVCVRYGNVLASRGSVIPLFHDQIRNGGPITVTVPQMTRFLLSLDQAVDTVFEALRNAGAGETYVPRAPSATVMNIARALVRDRPIRIDVTGVRPGEKMHEIMVSEEECNHTEERGGYFAILPMLPELRGGGAGAGAGAGAGGTPALASEFSSADVVLSLEETSRLLAKHGLMVEDVHQVLADEELLR